MIKPHILVVEDEVRIQTLICKYLELESYDYSCLDSGRDVVSTIRTKSPSLVILDVMLPHESGLVLCQAIRRFSDVPIIFLTAKVDEVDKLLGFKSGADDYMTKPFSPKELLARIAAILKRSQLQDSVVNEMWFKEIRLDCHKHQAYVNEELVNFTLNEFNLLKLLLSEPGKVFSRKELLYATKQLDIEIYQRSIDTHIKNMRRKIATLNCGKHYIRSIYGVGYQLEHHSTPIELSSPTQNT